ncbi:hypothetical protein MEO41_23125, partial [Dolichospermum sp. ST_sed4]|nr:hypothetical protein [Dolichospermum sp. ST_sed4]
WGDPQLKTLPCICLHYLTQSLLGITGAIRSPKTLYLFRLSHLTITRDYWGDPQLKTLPCICLHYLTQPLLGITGAIARLDIS